MITKVASSMCCTITNRVDLVLSKAPSIMRMQESLRSRRVLDLSLNEMANCNFVRQSEHSNDLISSRKVAFLLLQMACQ